METISLRASLPVCFLDHDTCLKRVVLREDGLYVKRAAEKMMSLKGVKHVKLTTASLGKDIKPGSLQKRP
jgi:metal-responsive CopG/Arc/MetJ family transcriptional regulator